MAKGDAECTVELNMTEIAHALINAATTKAGITSGDYTAEVELKGASATQRVTATIVVTRKDAADDK